MSSINYSNAQEYYLPNLVAFDRALNLLRQVPADVDKMLCIITRILEREPLPPLEGDLATRAQALEVMMVETAARATAQRADQGAWWVWGRIGAMLDKERSDLQAIKTYKWVFPDFPSCAILEVIEIAKRGFQDDLVKWVVKSMVKIPSSEEINSESLRWLKEKALGDPSLYPYTDAITFDLILSEEIYYLREHNNEICERYSKQTLKQLPSRQNAGITEIQDPVTRAFLTIKRDFQGGLFVRNKILSFLYPDYYSSSKKNRASDQKMDYPIGKPLFFALKETYAVVQEEYKRLLLSMDPQAAIPLAEGVAKKFMSDFMDVSIVSNLEDLPLSCYPYMKQFIEQGMKEAREGKALEMIRGELNLVIGAFIQNSRMIARAPISAKNKEKAFELISGEMSKGTSQNQIREMFVNYMQFIQEEEIRLRYPGYMIGAKEWTCLGEVEDVPLPEGMLNLLNEPWQNSSEKTIGDVCVLLLMPKTIGGEPLTLRNLGELIERKNIFRKKRSYEEEDAPSRCVAGYFSMDPELFNAHGNDPIATSYWVLMTRGALAGSRNQGPTEQKERVANLEPKGCYRALKVLEAVAWIYMTYIGSGDLKTRLFSSESWRREGTRCEEDVDVRGGYHSMTVGEFNPAGLTVSDDSLYYIAGQLGIVAARQL